MARLLAALLALAYASRAGAAKFNKTAGPSQFSRTAQSSGTLFDLIYLYGYPDALCNDGTVGGFYFAPAVQGSPLEHLWVVYLEGGAWCYDNESCLIRTEQMPQLTGSNSWWWKMTMGGIFDRDPKRSPFAGANLIYVAYCSSDAWVGNVGASAETFGWHFRGQKIVEALFDKLQNGVVVTTKYEARNATTGKKEHLANTTTYSMHAHDKVLFGGCSAGSRGAMFNIDYVQSMLPAGMAPVVAFLDSPLWVDEIPITGPNGSIVPLEYQTQQIYNLVNATARLGDDCAAAYPASSGEQWKCLYGQYRLPFVKTPYLMSASQFDKYQLPYNEGGMPPYNGTALAYANNFQQAVRSVVLNLPTSEQPQSAVFSSACFKHCTSTLAWGSFWGVRIGELSLRDYLEAWYFGGGTPSDETAGTATLPPGYSKQHIEACNGFGCGQCHRKANQVRPAPPLPPAYTLSLYPGEQAKASYSHGGANSLVFALAAFTIVGLLLALALRQGVWMRALGVSAAPASLRSATTSAGGLELGSGPFSSDEQKPLLPGGALKTA